MAKKVTDRFPFVIFPFSDSVLVTQFCLNCVLYGTLESSKNDGKGDKISKTC